MAAPLDTKPATTVHNVIYKFNHNHNGCLIISIDAILFDVTYNYLMNNECANVYQHRVPS